VAVKSERREAGTGVWQTGQREGRVGGEEEGGRRLALGDGGRRSGEEGGELREEVGLEAPAVTDGWDEVMDWRFRDPFEGEDRSTGSVNSWRHAGILNVAGVGI